MLFSLLKHYLELCITDTALKVSKSLYCFTTSISHGVENYFPRLLGMGISDAILILYLSFVSLKLYFLFLNIKYYLDLYKADTVYSESLLTFEALNCFTSSESHCIENYIAWLWAVRASLMLCSELVYKL